MNKKSILWGMTLVFAVAIVVIWFFFKKVGHQDVGINPATQAKVIAPARQIPTEVTQNMQEALAEREKKLQALQAASDTKHKAK